jgi:Asp-tRNA(Asn)/Glu-tRNA(Gln) amidotransferase A subunit family amidase
MSDVSAAFRLSQLHPKRRFDPHGKDVVGGCAGLAPLVNHSDPLDRPIDREDAMHEWNMHDELDLLDQAETDTVRAADEMAFATDVDRRQFVFLSLVTAAATTFGFGAKALAQGVGAGGGGGRGAQGPAEPPVPLDNMEPISWTFQPYPGGTGALLEKTYRERGLTAFDRQRFAWDASTRGGFRLAPWGKGALPATDEEIAFLPAHRLAAAIYARKLTSVRITTIYLERLKRLNPTLLCAVTILEDRALADAARMDAELKAGKYRGPLHGIPWGVKDLFAVKGTPTTWGAADFENRVIDEDAEVVRRLSDAGAVLIAKLSSGQFAQGANWFRGTTKNPWNTSQASGGSSAGPASATGAGCVAFGIGTETNGSIVGPANTCGINALRPTFGRVSRFGGMVLAWSQDRVGPLTRSSQDAAMVFNVIHGADEKDPGTITMPFHFNDNIDLASLRIGVRRQNQPTPDANFAAFVERLKALGAKPTDLADPPTVAGARDGLNEESAAAFDSYVQFKAKQLGMDMTAVIAAYGAGGRGGRGGAAAAPPGAPAAPAPPANNGQLNRWVPGRIPTAMDFIQAQRRRQMLTVAWHEYLKDTDVYIGASDTNVHAATGHPAVVVPIGFGIRAGRGGGGGGGRGGRGGDSTTAPAAPPVALNPQPICAQIAGNHYLDDVAVSVAHKYQVNTAWHLERPKLG